MRCRVFLVEDSALMRSAIIAIVANECELVGWADNAHDVLDAAGKVRPDVILLDISLPGISGLAVLPQLRSSLPHTAVVVLTNHSSAEYFEEAFRRGASGYVLKSCAQTSLLPTIRRAAMAL